MVIDLLIMELDQITNNFSLLQYHNVQVTFAFVYLLAE